MRELPNGWAGTKLGQILSLNYGKSLPATARDGGQFAVFGSNGIVGQHSEAITSAPAIVVGRKGSFGEVHFSDHPCFPIDTTYYVDLFQALDARFAFHLLRHLPLTQMNRASAIPGLNREDAYALDISLPPLPEQQRIVAKIDGLTARTARARKELDRLPTLIARYKQRLLALAFSGELPALNPNAEKAELCAVGDIVDISSGYGFPKDRQGKTTGDFPFAKVSDISRAVSGNGGTLATAANYVDQEDLRTLKAKPVAAGSVVFAKIGEALKLNRRAITTVPLILDNNCMALTPEKSKVLPAYLLHFMETIDLGPLSVATAVPSVRRGDVASLQILLPSLEEQAEIIRRIDSTFGWLNRVAADHAAAERLLPKLDAAILAKAFRGELVPQDPEDEPAAKLLARIKAEREATPKEARVKRPRKPVPRKDLNAMPKKLEDVLTAAGDWVSAQDAFEQCGVGNSATTAEIEKLYAELRVLDKAGKLEAEPVRDDEGRKLHDRLRLKVA